MAASILRGTGVRRTLIVDDEDDMRALLRVVLSDGSGTIDVVGEASDGTEALEKWRTIRPDVIVLDQRMPGLTGMEVAERILAEDPRQPIVLFSAYLTEAMRERARQMGVVECISKEEMFSLPEAINRLLPDTAS
jgi:two-component system chemotaxis response regulator CheY